MIIARGSIWLVDFGEPVGREQAGRRPAVVISADDVNRGQSGVVIVIPCTTARRGLPSHIEIDPAESGLSEMSYAKCEDVKSVSVERFVVRVGDAPSTALVEIEFALRYLLFL